MSRFQKILLMVLLVLSVSVSADKAIFYSDDKVTIYTDNTVVQTGKTTAPVFEASSTWVEEDYFTQQEKYCEVDSVYKGKLKILSQGFKNR
ncbi:hypothetical protein R5P06_02080 [Candidatus Thioglobus autotrophicus]|uniref:hypothetical protein n=1 Tax=Candidatus Thioglobus autotrophicus TaxID=1705394 RepID=UPI00299D3B77|nr:hypothetical protein [Candidatus Thioglobus autotrophicus]WPE16863.1 hypothetical protein R5P06_02080 [Candidatus Thioglobus autotrophicus]